MLLSTTTMPLRYITPIKCMYLIFLLKILYTPVIYVFFSTAGTLGLLNFDNGHIITEQLHSFSNMLIVDFMVEYKREFYEITLLTKSFTYNSYCLVRAKLIKENDNWGFLVSDITALFSLQSMLTCNINRRLHCMTIVNEESSIFFITMVN